MAVHAAAADVRAELDAAADDLRLPAWRVVNDAIRACVGSGPRGCQRKSVARFVRS